MTENELEQIAGKVFEGGLGQQLLEVFMTSDGQPFIRHHEAGFYLREEATTLEDKRVYMFYNNIE